MNQKQYLGALKKALKGIDNKSRDNILLEIEGLISELDVQESIEDRFGSPSHLAKQYLVGEKLSPTVGKKAMSFGKKFFLSIGIGVTLLVAGIAVFGWYFSQDKFDFSDLNADELDTKKANWHSVEWSSEIKFEVKQGRAVVYWHDQPSILWNCGEKQNLNIVPNEIFSIRHDQCLIFVPKQELEIQAKQADVVLIKPQTSTNIILNQSKLRISEKGEKYKYEINATRSQVGDFMSHDAAQKIINIKSEESSIKAYEY